MRTPEQIFAEAEKRVGQWIGAKVEGSAQEVMGRYYLEKLLGCGGMGAVYQAYDYDLDRRIAFKIVNPLGLPEYGSRFRREGRSMARLNCPNIVKVYDIGSNGDELFLSMEILDGEDLEARLEREGIFGEDRFDEAVDIMMQALYGLAHAHVHGVTHRDMKPANLFLARENGSLVLKVLDFGIARMDNTSVTVLTQAGSIMGTPQYMSPEQLGGAEAMGPKSDVFSLGVIWYEMFTGEQAYGRPPAGATKNPDWAKLVAWRALETSKGFDPYLATLPAWLTEHKPEFVKVLARVLDPDPEKRYEGAMETLKALAEATGRTAPPAPEVSTFAEMTRMMPTYSPAPPAPVGNNDVTLHERPVRPNSATLTPKPVTTPKGLPGVRPRRPPVPYVMAIGLVLVLAVMFVVQLSTPSKAGSSRDAGATAARPQPTALTTLDAGMSGDSGFADVSGDASIEIDYVGDVPVGFISRRNDCDGSFCELVIVPGDPRWVADAAVETEVDATSETTGRHGRHRDRDNRRNQPPSPPVTQTEAEQLRAQLVRACCAGQGGGAIAEQLRNDPDHPVRGLTQCQAPDSPCDIVHGDRRPWCRLCQPKCRRGDRRPECNAR